MTSTVTRRALWGAGLSILLSIAGGGAVMLGLPQHFEADAATETAAAPPPAVPVSVARAQSKRITTWEEFSGRLEAIERVEVRPRVGGAVLKAHFREGALVKRGDLLVTIDPEPYAAAVERAKAQVEAALPAVEEYHTIHGSYLEMTLPALEAIDGTIVLDGNPVVTESTFCIQSTVGRMTRKVAGPGETGTSSGSCD